MTRPPEKYRHPDLNPYLKLHREFGPPVLTSEELREHAGHWDLLFGREAPLHLEIGSGNGFFLAGMASRHPEWNWLGLEKRFKRVVLTARKILAAEAVGNARIGRYDAHCLGDLFGPGSLSGVYLNHPDPWPRDSQAKHRLLGPEFCAELARLLQSGADFRLKTDHWINVEAFLEHTQGLPFVLEGRSDDIARDGAPWPDDLTTNYQRKFNEREVAVYGIWLRRE